MKLDFDVGDVDAFNPCCLQTLHRTPTVWP